MSADQAAGRARPLSLIAIKGLAPSDAELCVGGACALPHPTLPPADMGRGRPESAKVPAAAQAAGVADDRLEDK